MAERTGFEPVRYANQCLCVPVNSLKTIPYGTTRHRAAHKYGKSTEKDSALKTGHAVNMA